MQYNGLVFKKLFAAESKSEHESVCIKITEGEFNLRRVGGNPFVDDVLEQLIGESITCDGEIINNQLIITSWTVN